MEMISALLALYEANNWRIPFKRDSNAKLWFFFSYYILINNIFIRDKFDHLDASLHKLLLHNIHLLNES